MSLAPRYSLWLLLPPEAHARYQALIAMLSARLGTPGFEPHITLLGDLAGSEQDLRWCTHALAAAVEPFEARLLKAAWFDEYYRCLFVTVALSRALQQAHDAAGETFGQTVVTEFYPHLSLVYGDLTEREKMKIVGEIGSNFDETIRLEELALYETGGTVWRCVERRRLGGTATGRQ